ncbi:hypothetical protein QFZ30_003735 [Arthrobacter pascens]|uniref:HNH endonuclease signature motif containing protein n=1 Tax=Arthrobacter pascens TaxID=1677 RepID=UPI002791C278|nr:HNH endonuclease signature motif containing protein [Arthrobacter pascens]MDQ0680353.1 hypothetical protein [Arthrobacter pascens]
MEKTAADETLEAFEASAAALVALVRRGTGIPGSSGPDPLRDQADACLDGLAESARVDAMLAALRVHLTAGYADKATALATPAASPQEHTAQEMAVVAEVACVLTVSERAAGALLTQSHELTSALPLTLAALEAGSISWQHARAMVDETAGLDPAGAQALEAHFLDPVTPNPAGGCPAGELLPSRFRHKARTWRERHHRVSIETRHAKSAQDRRLDYAPDRDGMAWLSAYLPADQAAGIWARTTTAARALQGPHEARTVTQLRADLAATWLLTNNTAGDMAGGGTEGGTGAGDSVPSPAAQVLIIVPVLSLLGATDGPATLDGYGPIPASMARRLVADGADSFHRVLTDPRDGAPLEIGRTSYRIPKTMRQWLRLRDGKCPFPGCNNHSLDNEADHVLAWADGGTTGITNLGQPCRKHHRLKHTTSWTPSGAGPNKPPGWTSPTGRHYASEQQDWEPPRWPAQFFGPVTRPPDEPEHPESPDPDWDPDPDGELGPARGPDPYPDWEPGPPLGSEPDLDHGPGCGLAMPEDPLPDDVWPWESLDEPWPEWAEFQAV